MTSTLSNPPAVVLFGHGSRDPLWRGPIEDVARRIAASAPATPVRCAYLELTQPDLHTVVAELAKAGSTAVRIVPMFLGTGRHAREDLPELVMDLRQRYPAVAFELQVAVGEDPRLLELLANIALGAPAG